MSWLHRAASLMTAARVEVSAEGRYTSRSAVRSIWAMPRPSNASCVQHLLIERAWSQSTWRAETGQGLAQLIALTFRAAMRTWMT